MESLPQKPNHVIIELESSQVADVIAGLLLLGRYRVGEPAARLQELHDMVWKEFMTQVGRGRAT